MITDQLLRPNLYLSVFVLIHICSCLHNPGRLLWDAWDLPWWREIGWSHTLCGPSQGQPAADDGRRRNWPKRCVQTNTQDEDESPTNYSIRRTNASSQSLRKTQRVPSLPVGPGIYPFRRADFCVLILRISVGDLSPQTCTVAIRARYLQ